MNLAAWLERAGRVRPEAPAVGVGAADVLSYGELARRAGAIAEGLATRHGLREGDRVAIVAKNDPSYVEALFAAWWGGFAAVPVNPKLHPKEVAWILGDCGARAIFVSDEHEAAIGAMRLDAAVIALGSVEHDRLAGGDRPAAPVDRDGHELAWLFYTSGTTGRPKGAMLSHANLSAMALAYLAEVDPTRAGDALLHAAPMSHGSGLYLLPHVARGAINVIPESSSFDAAEAIELARVRPGLSMFAAPTMVNRLAEAAPGGGPAPFRTVVWGGAPMFAADVERAVERLGPCLAQIYGQGESPMTITFLGKDDVADRDHPRWHAHLASAGVASSAVAVRTAGADGRPVPVGELGEVQVRGATVMSGYWNDPAATEAALVDGWLRTGDVGSFGEDGYLTLRDRTKDVIISGGSNIYPREVEEILLSHPDVREASVIGREDPEWGEIVVAYVAGEADPGDLDRLCLDSIARFKRPKDYIQIAELPKSSTGKVLKSELRDADRRRPDASP